MGELLERRQGNMLWKILNMADFSICPDLLLQFEAAADVHTFAPNQKTLLEKIGEYDAYLASLHIQANADVINRADRLRVIATPSTGSDHIDLIAAQTRGIHVITLKEDTEFLSSITSTAELTWGLLLATVRCLPWAFDAAKKGEWARDRFRGSQLSGKTFGILGYGRLGRMVAEYALAFRMRVIVHDIKPPNHLTQLISSVSFDTLLRESDILSIHVHLSQDTRQLINGTALKKMKRGATLLNTSRGAVVDETALLDALDEGHLAGAGLDVIDGEWRSDLSSHALIEYANRHQNLVITPHIGGVTSEAQTLTLDRTVVKLISYLQSLTGTEGCPSSGRVRK